MEYSELIQKRFSVRQYSGKPVEAEKLQAILEAGRIAPTARNSQVQRILVVQSPEGLKDMDACSPCRFGAPLVLVACFDSSVFNGNYGRVDASIVLTHMMLKAAELGLGSVWVGFVDTNALHEKFNIPEDYEVVSILPMGYAEEGLEAPPKKREPLEHTVQYERFA